MSSTERACGYSGGGDLENGVDGFAEGEGDLMDFGLLCCLVERDCYGFTCPEVVV